MRGGDEYLGQRGRGDLVEGKDIYGAMRRYVVTSSGILDVMMRYVSSSNVVYDRRCLCGLKLSDEWPRMYLHCHNFATILHS
jgi:hypothetical protein